MGKSLDATIDEDVHRGLMEYLEEEFGNTKAKSIIVNLAIREFLERKGKLANHRKNTKENPGQGSLFK